MSPVDPALIEKLKTQYPHVDGISDWRAQQSIRLLWDRVFDLEARLQAVALTQGDLVLATNLQEDQLAALQVQANESTAQLQTTSAEREAAEEAAGGVNTMPNYGTIVKNVLQTQFASPWIVPLADGDEGKAQLTRAAAWEIYSTVDDRIRLLSKSGTNAVNGRSTDLLVLGTDGSWADVSTYEDNEDGTATIKARWGGKGIPDKNTSNESRWITPSASIAAESGPMTPI